VSGYLGMNMKPKRTPLNVEFKQFQRLPDWPIIIKSIDSNRSSEAAREQRIKFSLPWFEQDGLRARSFAE